MDTWNGQTMHPAEVAPAWDQADAIEAARAQRVEDYADFLMDECSKPEFVARLIVDWELDQTPLLAELIRAVAMWSGRSIQGANASVDQMPELHNILFRHLRDTISEREVE